MLGGARQGATSAGLVGRYRAATTWGHLLGNTPVRHRKLAWQGIASHSPIVSIVIAESSPILLGSEGTENAERYSRRIAHVRFCVCKGCGEGLDGGGVTEFAERYGRRFAHG